MSRPNKLQPVHPLLLKELDLESRATYVGALVRDLVTQGLDGVYLEGATFNEDDDTAVLELVSEGIRYRMTIEYDSFVEDDEADV